MTKKRAPYVPDFTPPKPQLRVWKVDGKEIYEYRTESLRISVCHHIDHPPDVWCVSCFDINLRARPLKGLGIETAKQEALDVVRDWLTNAARELTS